MKKSFIILLSVLLIAAALFSVAAAQDKPVVVLLQAEPISYDPAYTQSDAHMQLSIHQTLFRLDNDGNAIPGMALDIEPIDELTWKLTLRQGVKFHNGEEMTADDVVFTMDRATELFGKGEGDLTFAMNSLKYEKFTKIDDYTLEVKMQVFDPLIKLHMVNSELSILPRSYYEGKTFEQTVYAPVGVGPYKVVSYEKGVGTVLVAHEDYYEGAPAVKNILVRAVPEIATRISELKSGAADLINGIPADLQASVDATNGVHTQIGTSFRRLFFALKQGRHPSLADVKVRQALNFAFDCQGVAENLMGGMTECFIDVINSPGRNPDLAPYPYDPEMAKQLLDEAGWVMGASGVREKDGLKLEYEIDTTGGSSMYDKDIAQVFADNLKDVGIGIKDLRVIDNATHSEIRKNQGEGYRDILLSSSGPDYTCQGDFLLVQKDSGSNRMSWADETFEANWQAFKVELDESKWQEMCWGLEEYVKEQAPIVFMYTEPIIYGVSDRLDFTPRVDGRLYFGMVLKGVK